jgi:hypothetical protein
MNQLICPHGCCYCYGEQDLLDPFRDTVGVRVDVTQALQVLLELSGDGRKSQKQALSLLLKPSTPKNVVHLWRVEKLKP